MDIRKLQMGFDGVAQRREFHLSFTRLKYLFPAVVGTSMGSFEPDEVSETAMWVASAPAPTDEEFSTTSMIRQWSGP